MTSPEPPQTLVRSGRLPHIVGGEAGVEMGIKGQQVEK